MPDNDELLNAIDAYANNAYGSDKNSQLSTERSLALDAYAAKNIEPAPEGRSQVQDWTVFETIQWILPSLTRIFAGGDDVVEFEPEGPEDEDAAKQESQYLNYLVTQKNNWFLTCLTWFQDALLTKNAYCLAFMEEILEPELEEYKGQTEEQIAMLLDDDVEVVGQSQYDDPDDETGMLLDPFTGQPIDPMDDATMLGALATYEETGQEPQIAFNQLYDIQLRRVSAKNKLQFKVLPPERCLVAADTPDFTLNDCNYFEYWDTTTISQLRKLGYEIDDEIADSNFSMTEEDVSRDEALDMENSRSVDDDYPDPSMRMVQVRNVWIRHDYDGDGIAELQHVVLVGREVLERNEVNRIPVASVVPFINTHRHMGNSVADLVFDIQRIKTSILRNGLDSLNFSQRPRQVISTAVNVDDLMVHAPGSPIRLEDGSLPGEGHVVPLHYEFVFPQAQEGLRHMDTVVESRVGVNRMFQGIDESNINDHNRVGQLSTMAAQRVEQIARLFANGVENLFSIAHELVIKAGRREETIRLSGQWVNIDPTAWKTSRDMRIVAPFAAGNKDSLVQRLMLHLDMHSQAHQMGASFVDESDTYELAKMLASATDLPGDRIYTDPETVEPPPPQPDPTMIALEIEQQKVENDRMKIENSKSDSTLDAEVKKYDIDVGATVDKYKTDKSSETQIALAALKGEQSKDLESTKAGLRDAPINKSNEMLDQLAASLQVTTEQLTASLNELSEAANAPREIVYGENGRPMGVKVNGKVREFTRNEQGKITGV
jgi:hypothetical protein